MEQNSKSNYHLMVPSRNSFSIHRHQQITSRVREKIIYINTDLKAMGMGLLISNKANLRARLIATKKGRLP